MNAAVEERRAKVLAWAQGQTWRFEYGLPEWLPNNWPIWERFEGMANAVWARGRRHYSAWTIGAVIRHETALHEAEGDFKLANGSIRDMARLYMMLYPERQGFFTLRDNERTQNTEEIAA